MRRPLLLTALALPALVTAPRPGDAAQSARQCPVVKVSCPDAGTHGRPIDFKAVVDGAGDGVKLTYNWELSAGVIAGDSGKPSISADTTGLRGSYTVTATVEVGGLAEGCERKSSCSTAVTGDPNGCRLDIYGAIPFDDEKARLDNFAFALQNDPTSDGYMMCYGGRRGRAGEARRRCERARGYLSGVRGIGAKRVVIVDGGYMETFTVSLWVVPSGAFPPEATPTVDPRDVVIIKGGARRGARRR